MPNPKNVKISNRIKPFQFIRVLYLNLKKLHTMKTRIFIITLISSFFLTVSCNKEDQTEETPLTVTEATVNAQVDMATDDVSKVVEEQLTTEDGISGRNSMPTESLLPTCATITRVPAYGTPLNPGDVITKTIDFGTTGCAMPNGNILKGQIIISFEYQPSATSHTINYSFVNFYHNAIKINGAKTFTRVLGTSAANSETHPIVTMTMNLTATMANGGVFRREGSRVREIVAGQNTPELTDNVYQVTGSWTTTSPNGIIRTSTITNALIIKLNCSNIVQGIITFTRNGNTSTLNYGNGDCDNQAVVTINGVPFTITLRN